MWWLFLIFVESSVLIFREPESSLWSTWFLIHHDSWFIMIRGTYFELILVMVDRGDSFLFSQWGWQIATMRLWMILASWNASSRPLTRGFSLHGILRACSNDQSKALLLILANSGHERQSTVTCQDCQRFELERPFWRAMGLFWIASAYKEYWRPSPSGLGEVKTHSQEIAVSKCTDGL